MVTWKIRFRIMKIDLKEKNETRLKVALKAEKIGSWSMIN